MQQFILSMKITWKRNNHYHKKCPFQLVEITWFSNFVCNFENDYVIKIEVVKPKIEALQNRNH